MSKSVYYTKQELETISKFLKDAQSYEKKNKEHWLKHWLKKAVNSKDDDTFLHLAYQAQARLDAIENYQQYVDNSIECMTKNDFETSFIFIK